jgi:hypothetical protein
MSVQPRLGRMSPSAQPRLFSIPELVQMVLFHLPPRHLLRVQRVCRLWKDTTEHSFALQKKLRNFAICTAITGTNLSHRQRISR